MTSIIRSLGRVPAPPSKGGLTHYGGSTTEMLSSFTIPSENHYPTWRNDVLRGFRRVPDNVKCNKLRSANLHFPRGMMMTAAHPLWAEPFHELHLWSGARSVQMRRRDRPVVQQ